MSAPCADPTALITTASSCASARAAGRAGQARPAGRAPIGPAHRRAARSGRAARARGVAEPDRHDRLVLERARRRRSRAASAGCAAKGISRANACASWCGPTATIARARRHARSSAASVDAVAIRGHDLGTRPVRTVAAAHAHVARGALGKQRATDRSSATMKSLSSPRPPNAACSTFANTCADAMPAGVLSAARQSGSHSAFATRGGNGASICATVSPRRPREARALERTEPARCWQGARAR